MSLVLREEREAEDHHLDEGRGAEGVWKELNEADDLGCDGRVEEVGSVLKVEGRAISVNDVESTFEDVVFMALGVNF